MTYAQARPIADSAIASYQGGGWALILAAGTIENASYTAPLNLSSVVGANCTFTPAPGVPANLTIPAFGGNRSAGTAPVWEFGYRNGAGSVAIVSVLSGKATILGTVSGGFCTTIFALLTPVPSNVIDSSAAARAAEPNASSFLAQYPNASGYFALIGGISFLGLTSPATWSVTYSTCSFNPTASGTGTQFNATVNALTGQVIYSETQIGVVCGSGSSGGTPLGSVLAFTAFSSANYGATWAFNASVASAVSNPALWWSNLTVSVTTPGGTPVAVTWSLTAFGIFGSQLATYSSTNSSWSVGANVAILAGDTVSVQSTADLSGDLLALSSPTGAYTGSVTSVL